METMDMLTACAHPIHSLPPSFSLRFPTRQSSPLSFPPSRLLFFCPPASGRRHRPSLSDSAASFNRSPDDSFLEDGIFETSFRPECAESKDRDPSGDADADSLVPEEWKFLQHDLHKSKMQKKRELLMQERENRQLKELRVQIRRLKNEHTSEPSAESPLAVRPKVPDKVQLLELERVLTSKPLRKDQADKEFDKMFTEEEKLQLKKRIPEFSKFQCEKWPLLHVLVASGQYYFLEQLLSLGIDLDLNSQDEDGYTALQRAVQGRKDTAVSQLLNAGADANILDKDGANLLHFSVQVGSLNLVRLLIKHGVRVNHADKNGWTPLHVAVLTGRSDIVRHLILSGANKSLKNEDEMTPLDIVFRKGKGFHSYAVAKTLKQLTSTHIKY